MKKIYFNKMQREVVGIGANKTVVVAGRGTGKGVLHAAINLRNMQMMPRSTTAFVAANAKRALTNTLPSMFAHWETWGYKRGVHWLVGVKPPSRLGWPRPLYEPDDWSNFISFYTGAVGQIISQDRKGTSNSKSFDFLDVDEAKFVNFDRFKEETIQANRGQVKEFGHLPFHHGMLITSDMPTGRRGSWFMNYRDECDENIITLIQGIQAEVAYLKRTGDRHGRLGTLRGQLVSLQQRATLYRVYSSLTNMEVLGEDFIRQQKRDLPPLVFQTSILCIPPTFSADGFYSGMKPGHIYHSADFNYLESLGYLSMPMKENALMDGDIQTDEPLCIAFDWNLKINWLVVGQPDRGQRRLNVLKSFWVKNGRQVPELLEDFNKYYMALPRREVVFYYDSTALGSNYAINHDSFESIVAARLRAMGWAVKEVYIGKPMFHMEKHLLINRAFSGQTDLTPMFNEENNEDLLLSIRSAGIYNGKKDKRGEKLAESEEDKLEGRTDGSDAFDTLFIGCLKFPQRQQRVRVYSDFL